MSNLLQVLQEKRSSLRDKKRLAEAFIFPNVNNTTKNTGRKEISDINIKHEQEKSNNTITNANCTNQLDISYNSPNERFKNILFPPSSRRQNLNRSYIDVKVTNEIMIIGHSWSTTSTYYSNQRKRLHKH